ncbi:MAG: dipeptidyl peptidase 3, partial [Muribaculaceae bacterium]|nr:dipeptidyl peptidase 3 [Muribaculaceae bacterium]
MKHIIPMTALAIGIMASSCHKDNNAAPAGDFDFHADRFGDIEVLHYQVPDFDSLTVQQKAFVYYLTEAALWGRDIMWDQNCAVNLPLRRVLEGIYTSYNGDRNSADWTAFEKYMKQVWFGNGIHHHYSMDKFVPEFSQEFFAEQLERTGVDADSRAELTRVVFDPEYLAKRVNQADNADLVATSACNLYGPGLTQAEVEAYYAALKDTTDLTPISYGLNSRLAKGKQGEVVEQVYKIGSLYSPAIEKIVENLNKARAYAENDAQRNIIDKLVEFYTTGDLKTFDEYSIAWAEDTASQVDFINGFIESYGDPLGMTGSWESIVNFKNIPASRRTESLSANAQWFEDHSPVDAAFKKDKVKGVSAKVITAAILAGDSYPATPIGIN